jgi:hypothetical protein
MFKIPKVLWKEANNGNIQPYCIWD